MAAKNKKYKKIKRPVSKNKRIKKRVANKKKNSLKTKRIHKLHNIKKIKAHNIKKGLNKRGVGRPKKIAKKVELDSETARIYRKFNVINNIKNEIKDGSKLKKKPPLGSYTPEQISAAINMIKSNDAVNVYLTKNVSSLTLNVMEELKTPTTDDAIAAKLNLKVNAVRRILNILQNYGITNYYIAKNTNGWLSFAWYINVDKVPSFIESMNINNENKNVQMDENCNDYFICKSCYKETNVILPFDAAFENNFKCSFCSGKLEPIDKDELEKAMNKSTVKN